MLDQNYEENIKKFIARALGVPFRDRGRELTGWDCWGLVLLGFRQCFGLELPDAAQVSARRCEEAARVFAAESRKWLAVAPGRERPGDVALFRRGRWPCHAGLVIKRGQVLHVDADLGATCVEPFNRGLLKARLAGIYRHEQLA